MLGVGGQIHFAMVTVPHDAQALSYGLTGRSAKRLQKGHNDASDLLGLRK